jgi:hypothetical protein
VTEAKRAFLQVAIPILYVYDEDVVPPDAPGFDMGLLPVVSRVLKDHAGTDEVTVITGAPTPAQALDSAFTHLALQYGSLQKASAEAGNLIVAEFVADNFDAEKVLEHLKRIVDERQRELQEQVDAVTRRRGHVDVGEEGGIDETSESSSEEEEESPQDAEETPDAERGDDASAGTGDEDARGDADSEEEKNGDDADDARPRD